MGNKPKLIIFEGAPGAGKSTITRMFREKMKNTSLISESSIPNASPLMSFTYHFNLYDMIYRMGKVNASFILDRCHLSQKVYCDLNHVDFNFNEETEVLNEKINSLCDLYDVYMILLCANASEYEERLKRDKAQYIKHSVDESRKQQTTYKKVFAELETKASVIVLNNAGLKPEQTFNLLKAQIGE